MLRFQSSKKNLRLTYFQHILSDFFCQTCQSLWLWVYCSILPHINYNTQTNYNIQCAGFEPLLSQSPPMGCISGLNQCTWDNHYNIICVASFSVLKAHHVPITPRKSMEIIAPILVWTAFRIQYHVYSIGDRTNLICSNLDQEKN